MSRCSISEAEEVVGAFATESTIVGVHSNDIGREHIAENHTADRNEIAGFEEVVLANDKSHEIEVDDCNGADEGYGDGDEHLSEREVSAFYDGLRCYACHDDYP